MGWFSKLTIFFAMLSLYASFVHRPIPADVPDKAYFQFIVDYLSAVEIAASVTESLGFSSRWWSYPGNLDLFPVSLPFSSVEIAHTEFAGVNAAVLATKEFQSNPQPGPALVYLHGGGWVFGSYYSYKGVYIQATEETDFLVMAPEYRKAPEYPFPIPYEDCLNSTLEFMKRAKEFNVDPDKIVIIGDSAGGNLAMAVTMALLKLHQEDESVPIPAMTTLIYPVLQMANYQLPSYQQNQPFIFYPSLIPKFWLSYIGLNNRMDLAEIVYINGHVREEVKELVQGVSSDMVPQRYKVRGHNVTTIPLTLRQKSLLDESALNQIEKSFLDPRVAPLMVDDKMLKLMPRTHIVVCEYDTLRDDGILLYERLKKLNRNVSLQHLDALHASLNVGSIFQNSYYGRQNKITYQTVKDFFS